jgi:hypothetical protein
MPKPPKRTFSRLRERRFLNFPAPDAGSAHADTLAGALYQGMNGLKVQIPAALGHIVRVTDSVPKLRSTPADFTNFGHKTHSYPFDSGS